MFCGKATWIWQTRIGWCTFPFLHLCHRQSDSEQKTTGGIHGHTWGDRCLHDFATFILGLCENRTELDQLPVQPQERPAMIQPEGALWGTIGSGKSFLLCALACDLLASFHQDDVQRQRVVYFPDYRPLAESKESAVRYVGKTLVLSYANDEDALNRIAKLSDFESLVEFTRQESDRGVRIYFLVDQDNELDASETDSAEQAKQKHDARCLISDLSCNHVRMVGASANNRNAVQWVRKQLNICKMFVNGGLDDNEYNCWKLHFGRQRGLARLLPAVTTSGSTSLEHQEPHIKHRTGTTPRSTSLALLTSEEESRIKDKTGCVPVFLQCWSDSCDTPQRAWDRFVNMPEIKAAKHDLGKKIRAQLDSGPFREQYLDMYSGFMTQSDVSETPDEYDCRYMYVDLDNGIGKCVCGIYRDIIAQVILQVERTCFIRSEWRVAINGEVQKPNPNRSVLGFLVEHEILAQIWVTGIPLYADQVLKCDKIVYFKSGSEKSLDIEEGCILYVPSAYNYHRVDAIVRQTLKAKESTASSGPDQRLLSAYKEYNMRPLQVAGVQITLGDLQQHLHSENEFCSPDVMDAWYGGKRKEDVGLWFVWYAWQDDIGAHARDAVDLGGFRWGNVELKRKTRLARVQELEHVAVFLPVEDYEPRIKRLRSH